MNEIEHVIQRSCQPVNVFPVEGCDEGLVQLGQNGVSNVIANVLNVVQLLHAHFDILHSIEDILQQLRALHQVGRH